MLKLRRLIKPLALSAVLLTVVAAILEIPKMQRMWVRHQVAERVFEVKGTEDGGGGTGFQIATPSGTPLVITNSHVCELAQKDSGDKNFLLIGRSDHWMKRRILEISGDSDLCLIEGWPGLSGLSLGNNPSVGEMVSSIGHPHLGPTTMSTGEVVGAKDVQLIHHIISTGNKELDKLLDLSGESCEQPKNEITKMETLLFGEISVCVVKEENAIQTNVVIYGGNSGSPLVDTLGRVVGIMFAANLQTNWGFAVNLKHVKLLLKDY